MSPLILIVYNPFSLFSLLDSAFLKILDPENIVFETSAWCIMYPWVSWALSPKHLSFYHQHLWPWKQNTSPHSKSGFLWVPNFIRFLDSQYSTLSFFFCQLIKVFQKMFIHVYLCLVRGSVKLSNVPPDRKGMQLYSFYVVKACSCSYCSWQSPY